MKQFLDNPQVVLTGAGTPLCSRSGASNSEERSPWCSCTQNPGCISFRSFFFFFFLFSLFFFPSFFFLFFFFKKGSSDLHGDGEVDRRQHLWFLEIYVLKTAEHSRVIPLLRSMKPG